MDRLTHKQFSRAQRRHRVRQKVSGTAERPRLVASISNLHVTAQIIDDTAGKTLAHVTSVGMKLNGNLVNKAETVGQQIAQKAKKAGISRVVFDRSGRKYHGRLKALADKARSEGLEF